MSDQWPEITTGSIAARQIREQMQRERLSELSATPCSAPRIVEQWTFPIGGKMATLTIVATDASQVNPDDIDALFEITLLFKQQIMRRHRERPSPQDYEI